MNDSSMDSIDLIGNDSYWTPISNSTGTRVKSTDIGMVIVYVVTGAIVCSLNSLTIVSVIQYRDLRTKTNMYIVSLALADFFTGLLFPAYTPTATDAIQSLSRRNILLCPFRYAFIVMFVAESFLSILAISVDRFIYIVYPLHYHVIVTVKRTAIVIAVTWCISTVMAAVLMFTFNISDKCSLYNVVSKEYLLYFMLPCLMLILFVTFLMYAAISREALKQRSRIQNELSSRSNVLRFKSTIRSLRLFIAVYSVCVLCWVPISAVIIQGYTYGISENALSIAMCVGLLNSGMNFFLYVATNSDFKKALVKIFSRVFKCKCKTFQRHGLAKGQPRTVSEVRQTVLS